MVLTSSLWKSMEDLTACFVIDAIAFSLFSIMSITHWMIYSESLPYWFTTLIFISATAQFVILSYHISKKFPITEEMKNNMKKFPITSSNQEEEDDDDQKTDTPVANNKCCKCSSSASTTTANGECVHESRKFIKDIVFWNFTPSLSKVMILTSPWYKSTVDMTTFLMLEAFTFFLLSILSITYWVVLSEPLSCLLTTLIFVCVTAQFVKISYDMKCKKVIFITLSNQEDEDEDEEISQETDTPSSSSLTPPVANNKSCKCSATSANDEEEHEKFEKKWMKKCGAEEFRSQECSKFIEEMNELRNKCIEDRREWEQDRNTLLEGLSAANKSVQLYRSLLHEFDQIYTSPN